VIAHPASDLVNSVYMPAGKWIQRWSFDVPIATVVTAMIVAVVVDDSRRKRHQQRHRRLRTWSLFIGVMVVFLVLELSKWLVAAGMFI
jgi:hypothetical protein